jgi:cob(I)alamin adenosyltransferase
MKIYTKTGDGGETGLFGGPRVSKDSLRIEAYGTVDELNSALGVARAQLARGEAETLVAEIQHDLFALGAQLATPDPAAHQTALVGPGQIEQLERAIDEFQERLEPLREFVVPAGTPAAAALHLARTVCRRAERRVVSLMRSASEPVAGEVVVYLNRLSDLLFVLARSENKTAGRPDEPWRKPS